MAYLPPPATPPPRASLLELGSGQRSIDSFLSAMQQFKRSPAELARVRDVALELVRGVTAYNEPGEVNAVFSFVRDGIRYVKDVLNVDTLQSPTATLEILQGDCDDKSLLLAALLESIGYPTRFVVAATRPGVPYNHVYVETWVTKLGKWIPLESSVVGMPAGRVLLSFQPVKRYA